MDKVHPERTQKVLRGGRFVSKDEASNVTSVARMASLFDSGKEAKSPVPSKGNFREPSPLASRKTDKAPAPIATDGKAAKLPNGSTVQKNKVTITTSTRQASPVSTSRSPATNRAAFTKVIQVPGTGLICDERDERYKKVKGVLGHSQAGGSPTSPIKKPGTNSAAVIKPMGIMGYGSSSYTGSSYRLASYLNRTSGSPYRNSALPSPPSTRQAHPTKKAVVSPVKVPVSKPPPTPAHRYDDDYSDSSDDDTPDTPEESEETTPTSSLAISEKHPGGTYFKTIPTTSPPHKKSSIKTQGAATHSPNAIATPKSDVVASPKSSSHSIAVKQPGGLYFTSKTQEKSSTPTHLPQEDKKNLPAGTSSVAKSRSDLNKSHMREQALSKSKSTQELSRASDGSLRAAEGKNKTDGKKIPLITRDSSSSISVKIEREKASPAMKKTPSGSYKLPQKLDSKDTSLSQKRSPKERPKSFSDMSSLEPQLQKLMGSPSMVANNKTAIVAPSETVPKLRVTDELAEKCSTEEALGSKVAKNQKPVSQSTPTSPTRVAQPKNQVQPSALSKYPPTTTKKWTSTSPTGRPPTPSPKPLRQASNSCSKIGSPKSWERLEKSSSANDSSTSAFQMPALKPTGVNLRSAGTKLLRDGINGSPSSKGAKTFGPESVSVKSRIELWKTLEKEKKLSPHSLTSIPPRRGSEPSTLTDSPTKKLFAKSSSMDSHSASLTTYRDVLPVDSKDKTPSPVSKSAANGDIVGGEPCSSPRALSSPHGKHLDAMSPELSHLSSHRPSSGTPSPGASMDSSGRSTECTMRESEEEFDQIPSSVEMRRISSLKDAGVEDSIAVEVFDHATSKALESASSRCSVTDVPADGLKPPFIAEERLFSPTSMDEGSSCDEQSLPELSKDKSDAVFDDTSEEGGSHATYSYQEYTRLRKSKALASTTSTDSAKPAPLESIPENDVSEPKTTVVESERSSVNSQREEKATSSDSDTEFKRKFTDISHTFLDEVLQSITTAVLDNNVDESSDTTVIRKTSARIVAQLVQKQPELSEYAENIYETIKEYGHKVSQQKPVEDNDDEEEPPELPPRPKFLLSDKIEKDNQTSPVHDSYVLMHSDSTSSSMKSGPSVVPDVDDSGAYEPMFYSPQNIKSSKKKLKSPKKMAAKRASKKKEAEQSMVDDDEELEVPDSPKRKIASRGEESRQVMKKKRKRIFGRLSRDDSSKASISHSLPEGVRLPTRIGACVSPESAPTPEQAEFGSSEAQLADGTPALTTYMNIGLDSKRGYLSLPHNYRPSTSEFVEKIEPTHSSESDLEGPNLGKVVCNDDTIPNGSGSPSKVRWADRNAYMEDDSLTAADMEVCHEFAAKNSLSSVLDSQRFLANPLTPPLVTKVALTTFLPKGIRSSSSDPNIHDTLRVLSTVRGRRDTIAGTSPSPVPSLNRVDSSVDSTFSDGETSSLNQSICSFDSFRGPENVWRSPVPRKRMKSDTVLVDVPASSLGAVQKERLLLHRRKGGSISSATSTEPDGVIEVPLVYADALMDRSPMDDDELGFSVNDVIAVLDMRDDDWWQGMLDDRIGLFPASWVRLRIGQESDDSSSMASVQEDTPDRISSGGADALTTDASEDKLTEATEDIGDLVPFEKKSNQPERSRAVRRMTIRKKDAGDFPRKLTPTQVRARCVKEILSTERDYVQHLEDIVQGFLKPCMQHPKLFDKERIETVFSNVEDIYHFQKNFLAQLESRVVEDKMEDSQIGEVFVQSRHQFALYSEYCNNHPQAVNELNLLQSDSQFVYFFESLRLLRQLTDISLDGFLLTPVQKICRYPLQLSELLKYTTEDHPDHPHVLAAQDAMRDVAVLINERKRRMENVGMIGFWQETIDNWKGPDITDKSTELLHHGELQKISKGHSQERHFFLFDHQLVYCRKDVVGGKLSYKGRINLDKCVVVDIADGEVSHNGSAVKNAWKVHNVDKEKWYVIFAKSLQAKEDWKKAFEKERLRVEEDKETGFFVTDKMRKAAVSLCNIPQNVPRRKSIPRKNNDWLTESLGSAQIHRLRVDTAGGPNVEKSPTQKKKLKNKKK